MLRRRKCRGELDRRRQLILRSMHMDTKKVISTLNTLLETTEDGVRGLVACA